MYCTLPPIAAFVGMLLGCGAPLPSLPSPSTGLNPEFDDAGLYLEGGTIRIALDIELDGPTAIPCDSWGEPLPGEEYGFAWRRAGDGLDERWQPEGAGWHHAFVVARPTELLSLPVRVEGASVEIDASALGATLHAERGDLRYEGLLAWDSDGRPLPAWMEPSPEGIQLIVQSVGAKFPVVVDPLLSWTQFLTVAQPGASFSWAVTSLGDVNDDGYDDVAFGAHGWDNGFLDAGRILVHHGTPTGLTTVPA